MGLTVNGLENEPGGVIEKRRGGGWTEVAGPVSADTFRLIMSEASEPKNESEKKPRKRGRIECYSHKSSRLQQMMARAAALHDSRPEPSFDQALTFLRHSPS